MLEALIFDVDGTLAETEDLHRRAFNETFDAHGLGWHWDRGIYHRLLKTTGGKERMRQFIAEIGADPARFDVGALHREKTRRYAALVAAGDLRLRPGIAALIEAARAAGLRLAIATTTSRPNVETLSRATFGRAATEVFEVLACGDEVPVKKPAPDVYRLALDRLGLPARAGLALEDSRNGLLAARGAGLACVVSPSLYTRDEDFSGAAAIVAEYTEIAGPAHLARLVGG